MTRPSPRVSVLGCEINALTLRQTVDEVRRLIEARTPSQHCVVNAQIAVMLQNDEALRSIFTGAALVSADGQSIVWASKLLGRRLPERVAGPDIFEALLPLAEQEGWGVYFLGARGDIVRAAVTRAKETYPRLRISGWRDGYWPEGEDAAVVDAIRTARPDILFLAVPSPQKEYWLADRLQVLGVPYVLGVGGCFDVYSGALVRAPRWMQRTGLEWFFRFLQEPRRMWKRYLVGNARFMYLVAKYCLRDAGGGR